MPAPNPGPAPTAERNKPAPPKPGQERDKAGKPNQGESKTAASEPKTLAKTFDWSQLAPAEEDTGLGKVRGFTIDIIKETPEHVRNEVEEAFKKTLATKDDKRVDKNGKAQPYVAVYMWKKCGSEEMANAFLELARRYGKYRPAGQITVRGGVPSSDNTVARFCAKPYEARGPKTPTERKGESKTPEK